MEGAAEGRLSAGRSAREVPYEFFLREIMELEREGRYRGVDLVHSDNLALQGERRKKFNAPINFRNLGRITLSTDSKGILDDIEKREKDMKRLAGVVTHFKSLGYEPDSINLEYLLDEYGKLLPKFPVASTDPSMLYVRFDVPAGRWQLVHTGGGGRDEDFSEEGASLDRILIGYFLEDRNFF
ncbi:hypothetical protein J4447_01210 [Candidatus Pacearchaeota archaeon]|nr:hypothetical protein [Candidatus Pacearchaeota archaeon]